MDKLAIRCILIDLWVIDLMLCMILYVGILGNQPAEHREPQGDTQGARLRMGRADGEVSMKRYFCDKCNKQIDIEHDGFAQMRVMWWSRGGIERIEYKPDLMHRDGCEEFMVCATCANEMFGQLEGMEEA